MTTTLFKNGKIMDVVNEKIYDADILVEDGMIKEIGTGLARPEGTEVVDFEGNYVSPGLFNCHTHILMSGDPKEREDRGDVETILTAVDNCHKQLACGTTYIRDVGGMKYYDIQLRDAARKGMTDAPEMVVSGKNLCITGGHGWQSGREVDGADDARKGAREQLRAGADWVKVMATGGVMTPGIEPGSAQMTFEELQAAIEEAHKAGKKTATHAQGMEGIKNALRAGVDSIEHGFFLDDWCFDWMKEHGTYYVPTLSAMYWIKVNGVENGVPEFAVKKVAKTFDAHISSFKNAYKAGVKIALGTDADTPFNFHDRTAYEMVLMVKNGMTPWDAVKTGTVNAAELCSVSDTHGTIEVGKQANFTVYGGNPVEDIEKVMDCRMTVIAGSVKYKA